MKALSLTQPWATLVVTGEKRIETRSWSTRHEGVIAIHAAKSFPRLAQEICVNEDVFNEALRRHGYLFPSDLPTGAIIGTARLIGCRRTEDISAQLSTQELEFGDYHEGRFAWFLSDWIAIPETIPCRGALGLWTVPPDIEKALRP